MLDAVTPRGAYRQWAPIEGSAQVRVHLGESTSRDAAGSLATYRWGAAHTQRAIGEAVLAGASDTEASRPGVSVGSTSEFSLFFRIKSGHGPALREALQALQGSPGYQPGDYHMAVGTIHEARFVLFDDDTRLLFATSFDGPWDAYMTDFLTSGPTLALFDAVFQHVEGYEGLPDLAALQAFILGAQRTAAAYARNYPGTVSEIRKALAVNEAFQRVLDDPAAAEALQHPALKPVLDEAAD